MYQTQTNSCVGLHCFQSIEAMCISLYSVCVCTVVGPFRRFVDISSSPCRNAAAASEMLLSTKSRNRQHLWQRRLNNGSVIVAPAPAAAAAVPRRTLLMWRDLMRREIHGYLFPIPRSIEVCGFSHFDSSRGPIRSSLHGTLHHRFTGGNRYLQKPRIVMWN